MKKVVFLILTVFFLCFLSGCENFLDGSELKENLEDNIDYENADVCILHLQDNKFGSFYPAVEKECKAGYSAEIQFTVDPRYIYKGLSVFSNSDSSKNYNDYVQITPVSEDKEKGVYVSSVKLLKKSNDILIVPDCSLIPDGTVFPKMELSGVPQDTNITVTFNTPVDIENFYDANTNTLKNIFIAAGIENLIPLDDNFKYFEKPYLSESGLVLTIPSNKLNSIILSSSGTKDIQVVLQTKDMLTKSKTVFPENISWSYRINESRDKENPGNEKVLIYKDSTFSSLLSAEDFSDSWEDSLFLENHTGKDIYITASAYDAGSGVAKVKVYESLIRDISGNDVTAKNLNKEKFYTNLDFKVTDNTYETSFAHQMQLQEDGVVKVDVTLFDYSDNPSSTVSYFVIKDTYINPGDICPPEEKYEIRENFYSDKFYFSINANCLRYSTIDDEFIREPEGNDDRITIDTSLLKETFYKTIDSPLEVKELLWGYDDNTSTMQKAEFSEINKKVSFTRDRRKNTFIVYNVIDEAGNEYSLKRIIPHSIDVVGLTNTAIPATAFNPRTVALTKYDDLLQFGESCGYFCVFLDKDNIYKVFPSILNNKPNQNKNEINFNPFVHSVYYSSSSLDKGSDLLCHTGNINNKSLATDKDYKEFMEPGEYKIFIIPYIKYAERMYFGSLGNCCNIEVYNDNKNITYTPYKFNESYDVPCNKWKTIKENFSTENLFPNQEDVIFNCSPGPANSGLYKISVDFNQTNPGLYYSLYYRKSSNQASVGYSSDTEISLLSGEKYNIYLRVTDGNGFYKNSDYYWVADCTLIDNISPTFVYDDSNIVSSIAGAENTLPSDYVYPNGFRLFNINGAKNNIHFPQDASGIKTDSDGKISIDYYFIYLGQEKVESRVYTAEELEKFEKHTVKINIDDLYKIENEKQVPNFELKCLLPFDGLEEGYYEVYLQAEDIYGNKGSAYGTICNKIEDMPVEFSYNAGKLNFNAASKKIKYAFCEKLDENNCWKEAENYVKIGRGNYNAQFHCIFRDTIGKSEATIDISEISEGKQFIKINFNADGISTYTKYLYPDYYNTDYTAEQKKTEFPLKKKSFIYTSSITPELLVYCDSPVLVHTLWCSTNLADPANNENAALIWSSKAQEVPGSVMVEKSDFTYEVPVKNIENGKWYTTIIYFADGTVKMTEPKKK